METAGAFKREGERESKPLPSQSENGRLLYKKFEERYGSGSIRQEPHTESEENAKKDRKERERERSTRLFHQKVFSFPLRASGLRLFAHQLSSVWHPSRTRSHGRRVCLSYRETEKSGERWRKGEGKRQREEKGRAQNAAWEIT
jgi:hypothetical protein